MNRTKLPTTAAQAAEYEVAMPLLGAMYSEFQELSKKKADGAVSKPKIKIVNRMLAACRTILESESSIRFLDVIDEDDVPQNSDIVLVLSQYVAAMTSFYNQHYGYDGREHRWFVRD